MEYLKDVSTEEAIKVMQACKEDRAVNRFHNRGYTNDKQKSMRLVGRFPVSFLFHPEYGKYFDKNMDPHERRKGLNKLLKLFPEYMTVDER